MTVTPSAPPEDSAADVAIYDREGAPISLARYVELHRDDEYRTVASDAVGHRRVVTAWLGVDHGPLGDSDQPLIFGTVALEPDGQLWQGRELLTATEIEAREHHQALLQQSLISSADSSASPSAGTRAARARECAHQAASAGLTESTLWCGR